MKGLARIFLPAAVVSMTLAGIFGRSPSATNRAFTAFVPAQDTVVYPAGAYKLHRVGDFEDIAIADSLLEGLDNYVEEVDTLPHLTARDTIKVPDSLRLTDPFRYKYYVALLDSLTHYIVLDSLRHSSDSLKEMFRQFIDDGDSVRAYGDSLHARLDSLDWRRLDSIWTADSSAVAKAKFDAWYASLSRKERRRYDYQQSLPARMARMDSIRDAKEEKKAIRDSITQNTPRILETFALPDSMHYKRIISWNVDPDFHSIRASVPDTSYNHYYYDYDFQRKDVNATWLGVAGSPVQTYNWFKRKPVSGVEFFEPLEAWTFDPSTLPQYNTKTPYTELAYWGTLAAGDEKESDNFHLLSTQNILPALNMTFIYDRWGGGGILENEETRNKTFVAALNYLGKRYMGHAGFIHDKVERGENGGVRDNFWIRDTTVDSRDIAVNLGKASSVTKKNTLYLYQQYRIPFEFINRIRARKDTTLLMDASIGGDLTDSLQLDGPGDWEEEDAADDVEDMDGGGSPAADSTVFDDRDITTAFIGHSTDFSVYTRNYTDQISGANDFYKDYFFNPSASADSMGVRKFDNKVFLRLQPWASDAIVSKLDVGIGDCLKAYFDSSSVRGTKHRENSLYTYAGVEGQFKDYIRWNAKGRYVFAGYDLGDFDIQANASLNIYPFRRARKSPITFGAHFETSLKEPTFYQKTLNTNHFRWDNTNFHKISTTKVEGSIDIPRWDLHADLGYALLAGNVYYDTLGIARQNTAPMSVLSASLRKDFVIGGFLHLNNQALFQLSSNQEVLPLPGMALNLRYYLEFVLQKSEDKRFNVLTMQVGANAFYNTQWYAPSYNPVLGVFHNQNKCLYENGPYFDVFINMQWKNACIFLKFENAGQGWPMERADYFSAHNYIVNQRGIKIGIWWPFYISPYPNRPVGK